MVGMIPLNTSREYCISELLTISNKSWLFQDISWDSPVRVHDGNLQIYSEIHIISTFEFGINVEMNTSILA